jgi:hypothetical protein
MVEGAPDFVRDRRRRLFVNDDVGERFGRRAVCECGSRSTAGELRGRPSGCPRRL